MSQVKISGDVSGTGILTIAAPNTNSNFTLTLPATTAPILAGSGITLSASAPANTLVTDASGNVGIGTNAPSALKTTIESNGAQLRIRNTTTRYRSDYVVDNAGTSSLVTYDDTGAVFKQMNIYASPLTFNTTSAGAETARIDSSGNLLVGATSGSHHVISKVTTGVVCGIGGSTGGNSGFLINDSANNGYNAAAAVLKCGSTGSTRSINASGTINASGADYAEYMTKAGNFTVAKGDVLGIDAEGLLTNIFADALSFCVKSTAPSYVGSDTWGIDLEGDELEEARQRVDRIAFAGQVPVNVFGAISGQYIVPVEDNGGIKGTIKNKTDMTLAEYMNSVGKVIAVEDDGRARIIVKVA